MWRSKQNGTAIVTVLLILGIITVIATAMMVQQRIDIRRTQQIVTANQTYRYVQGVLYWAVGVIKQDNGQDAAAVAANQEEWIKLLPPTPIADGRGRIAGELIRLEQRINVNALADNNASTTFLTYLKENFPDLGEKASADLLNAIINWTRSPEQKAQETTGGEDKNTIDLDSAYLKLNPPYNVPHNPMVSISELRLVTGINVELYQKFLQKLVALPQAEPSTVAFYLLQADVTLDDQSLRVYSLLKRVVDNTGNAKVLVVYESRGTL